MRARAADLKTVKSTSIDIALNILELFSAEKIELGYLEQATERGRYRLGLKAFEQGCVCENQSDVIKEAMKELESLAKATTPASRCSEERIEEMKKTMQCIVQ